ncbi:ubiquitin thioesterase otubain-like isoform X1 [Cherax quadricarinatus]|uniref:ubiquitin thioesterase otubain-like isoform X1 n=1 Tax=Cherax quadricarinatus TaxID=27406 RepID=UPI0023787707|nr:ubiquitin thioesterase otubain-like isoform X1 [Cherax quadricarinatus]
MENHQSEDTHIKPCEYDPNVNQDELIMAQEKQIAEEIKANTSMIGSLQGLGSLAKEYSNDPVYSSKTLVTYNKCAGSTPFSDSEVRTLLPKFSNVRRTRPDGNCFLRGFIFAYLEYCIHHRDELTRFKKYLEGSKEELFEMGFPKFTTEDFHDMFMEVVNDLEGSGSVGRVEAVCNDAGTSDYLVVYLRLLISAHLQKNAEFFSFFIEGGRTVEEFCKQEVEPMYRECDHLHIVALTAAIGVGVRVMYLDRGEGAAVVSHDFPEDKEPIIHLLYRPGHYDILYKA